MFMCLWKSGADPVDLGLWVIMSLDSLQEQYVFLIVESSLQLTNQNFKRGTKGKGLILVLLG